MAISVTDGTLTLTPIMMTAFSSTRASTTTPQVIVGRSSGIPDFTMGAVGTRTGTLVYLVEGYSNAVALENMHLEQVPITFNQSDIPGMSWPYVLVGNLVVTLVDTAYDYYTVSVDFAETA